MRRNQIVNERSTKDVSIAPCEDGAKKVLKVQKDLARATFAIIEAIYLKQKNHVPCRGVTTAHKAVD